MSKPQFEYHRSHSFNWDSDLVDSIYYNDSFYELWVVLHGGRTYAYNGVALNTYNNFVNAVSAGQFYNKTIRGAGVYSLGFRGFDKDIDFVDLSAKKDAGQQYEVEVQVTLTVSVKVTADNFDSAAQLAMDEVEKIQGCETDVVTVMGVKKL